MTNFKTDEFLGKTVKNTRMFCSLGTEPINRMFQLRFAGGGNKFSQLCGFMFDSANENAEFPRFAIAFVCKLRSKIYRQQETNPSQWFIFKKINNDRVDVLDKKALLIGYGFDIEKFFDSDLFKKALPQFEKYVKKGLEDAQVFADGLKDKTEKQEAIKYIKTITDSMQLMHEPRVNDKYYQLNNLDAIDPNVKKLSAELKKAALDAKTDAHHKNFTKGMEVADKYSKKASKKDYVYQQLHGEKEELDEASYSPVDIIISAKKPFLVKDLKRNLSKFNDDDVIDVCDKAGDNGNTIVQMWNAAVEFEMTGHDDGRDNVCYMRVMPSKIAENDDTLDESTKIECVVKKEKQDGEEVFSIYEKDGLWVATFHDEKSAEMFAKEYPDLKKKYLDSAKDSIKESTKIKFNTIKTKADVIDAVNGLMEQVEMIDKGKEREHYDLMQAFEDLLTQLEEYSYLPESDEKIEEKDSEEDDVKNESEEDIKEKELDSNIEEALKEIYS